MNSNNLRTNPILSVIHFDIFTLFPSMFDGPMSESILRRAQEHGLMSLALHNIRDYTTDRHHTCDDTPYGGGGGMIMKPEPIIRSVETVLTHPPGWTLPEHRRNDQLPAWNRETAAQRPDDTAVVLLTPQGKPFQQNLVGELAEYARIALICGRYEGVDERVRTQLVTHEVSIGDFVLSGGELAAMVLVDALTRTIPGALGDENGAHRDSHSPGLDGLLEGPQYTRPPEFRGEGVPDILLSGHHGNVDKWRREQALLRTWLRRPELLTNLNLSDNDLLYLRNLGAPLETENEAEKSAE